MRKLLAVPDLTMPEQRAGATLPRDTDEAVFSQPWQAHAFSVIMSLYQNGHYNWAEWDDYLGNCIQSPGYFADAAPAKIVEDDVASPGSNRSPFFNACEKDGGKYYNHWLNATEQLLAAKGLVSKAELDDRVAALEHAEQSGPRFALGQRVTVREIKTEGHTHIPLYIRGKIGVVTSDRGLFVFPDAVGREDVEGHDHTHDHDHEGADSLQHVFCIRFSATDIWGESAGAGHDLNFNLWDFQLDPVESVA
jgi:hypothetical protein